MIWKWPKRLQKIEDRRVHRTQLKGRYLTMVGERGVRLREDSGGIGLVERLPFSSV